MFLSYLGCEYIIDYCDIFSSWPFSYFSVSVFCIRKPKEKKRD